MEWRTRGRLGYLAASSFLVFVVTGCNQAPARGVLSGKVLLDGKPLTGGVITFVSPVAGTATVFAPISESGTYGPIEVPAGELQVAVDNRNLAPPPPKAFFDPTAHMKSASTELRKRSAEAARQAPSTPNPAPTAGGKYVKIPDKYYQVESSGLKVTAERGEHEEDIRLSSTP